MTQADDSQRFYYETNMPFSGSGERKDIMDCDCCGKPWPESDLTFFPAPNNSGSDTMACPDCREEKIVYAKGVYWGNDRGEECDWCGKTWPGNEMTLIARGNYLFCPDCYQDWSDGSLSQ